MSIILLSVNNNPVWNCSFLCRVCLMSISYSTSITYSGVGVENLSTNLRRWYFSSYKPVKTFFCELTFKKPNQQQLHFLANLKYIWTKFYVLEGLAIKIWNIKNWKITIMIFLRIFILGFSTLSFKIQVSNLCY